MLGSEVNSRKKQDSNLNSGLFGQNNAIDMQINMHLVMNGLALPPTSTQMNSHTRGNDSLWSSSNNTANAGLKPHNF